MEGQENKQDELEMGELLSQHEQRTGLGDHFSKEKIVMAHVVQIGAQGVLVDIGLKTEAVIPQQEFGDQLPEEIREGAQIPVLRRSGQSPDGHPFVSYRKAREIMAVARIKEAFEKGTLVEGKITAKIRGGVLVDLGVYAFLPASQLDLRPVKNLDSWIGKEVQVYVLEFDSAKSNLVVSRKKHLEIQSQLAREETLKNLSTGQVRKGNVTSVAAYGAFVDLGGVEGLLHVSDVSWQRVPHIKDVIAVGQELQVMVLKCDAAAGKISLGLKQLTPHPWDRVPEQFPVGTVAMGQVRGLSAFGAFVEMFPGVEGLLHLSELSWTKRYQHPKELLKVGDAVEVKVVELDRQKEKLGLSLRQAQSNPWEQAHSEYKVGMKLEGRITHVTKFGAFVRLSLGLEGLLHNSDISWTNSALRPQDMPSVGSKVEVMVLNVDAKAQKISLGLKQLSPDPFKKCREGMVVEGTVQHQSDRGAVILTSEGLSCFLPREEYSEDHLPDKSVPLPPKTQPRGNANQVFTLGQTVVAKVYRINRQGRSLEISVRRYEKDQERSMVKKYLSTNSLKPSLKDILMPSEDEAETGS